MRFFPLVDFQYWAWSLFVGLTGAVLIYMAWGSYPMRRKQQSMEEIKSKEGHELESGHDVEKEPIAPFLIYIYGIIMLWSLAYMIYTGIYGHSF